jgi:phenylacetate-coenzyme A ligase PaaK-like adenylate-forming protein
MTIDELISVAPYSLSRRQKEELFVPLLAEAFERNARALTEFAGFLRKSRFDPRQAASIADFPPLPVTVFKHFALRTCAENEVVRELHSSGTTGQTPSRIFLDKTTLHRQRRALISILQSYLGPQRRPYLVLDVPEAAATEGALTARGAAIRGLENFAAQTVYAMRTVAGRPQLDVEVVQRFAAAHGAGPVLVFGFTFLIWSAALPALEAAGAEVRLEQATVFHGGGWKKLKEQQVSKDVFNARTAHVLGCRPERVLDFYGMVEQVGSIFVDCESGHKHPPNFATVIIRDPLTFRPQPVGKEGLIEVVSLLPASYPGQALLTEDQGIVHAIDDCPCGRKDVAFRFTSRVERAEPRGCGDVMAQRRQPLAGAAAQ